MPTAKLTTTSFLILGLLAGRDWSAYEIAEQLGRGVTELWPRAGRQLYNSPKRLVEEGMATARTEATGARSRTVYSITDTGRAALRSWLATEQVAPSALEFEGMIRVLLADEGTVDDLRRNLETMAEQARQVRDLFVGHAQFMLATDGGTHPDRFHLFAMVNTFTVAHFSGIVDWAEWALEQVEDWPDSVSPAQVRTAQARAALEWSIRRGARQRPPGEPG